MIFVSLIISLLITLAVEVPIAMWQKIPLKRAVAVNVLTNPIVVIVYHWAKFYSLPIMWVVATLEVGAVIAEGYFYKGHHAHPWIFALCANALSFGLGMFV